MSKIETKSQIEKALRCFPVEDLWGIGRQYETKLKNYGVLKAWDIVQLPNDFFRDEMGIYRITMKKELLGERQYEMTISEPKNNIVTPRHLIKEMIITITFVKEF